MPTPPFPPATASITATSARAGPEDARRDERRPRARPGRRASSRGRDRVGLTVGARFDGREPHFDRVGYRRLRSRRLTLGVRLRGGNGVGGRSGVSERTDDALGSRVVPEGVGVGLALGFSGAFGPDEFGRRTTFGRWFGLGRGFEFDRGLGGRGTRVSQRPPVLGRDDALEPAVVPPRGGNAFAAGWPDRTVEAVPDPDTAGGGRRVPDDEFHERDSGVRLGAAVEFDHGRGSSRPR
ncbi:hypothetical protein [Halorussus sp. MSC15.2]|uniref:hypothetical protein n=1 Tax=Halorussus sp. MSC15.2 TaxID=2283638 RepID=UPI0013D70CC2|nr:hypothetical protein [Halorussus sp. MSC15.2]NEU58413.1 hypothetical protein [Halorussus sp. MSC15.2]